MFIAFALMLSQTTSNASCQSAGCNDINQAEKDVAIHKAEIAELKTLSNKHQFDSDKKQEYYEDKIEILICDKKEVNTQLDIVTRKLTVAESDINQLSKTSAARIAALSEEAESSRSKIAQLMDIIKTQNASETQATESANNAEDVIETKYGNARPC